jgi:hypothetical protein
MKALEKYKEDTTLVLILLYKPGNEGAISGRLGSCVGNPTRYWNETCGYSTTTEFVLCF